MRDVQAVHAFVEKHRRRRQSNKVLHGHPSPTHWLELDIAMDEVLVGGIDATQDALQAMSGGDLDVTVFQDAAGQGAGALDAALKLARGEDVDQKVYVPFQLVTPDNMAEFQAKN